jgi:hypothetical protein
VSGPAVLEPTAAEWHAAAEDAIQETADRFSEFTVEDLEEVCGPPPAGSAWQGALLKAVHRGWIEKTDRTVKSSKASRKGGYIGTYRGLYDLEEDR